MLGISVRRFRCLVPHDNLRHLVIPSLFASFFALQNMLGLETACDIFGNLLSCALF